MPPKQTKWQIKWYGPVWKDWMSYLDENKQYLTGPLWNDLQNANIVMANTMSQSASAIKADPQAFAEKITPIIQSTMTLTRSFLDDILPYFYFLQKYLEPDEPEFLQEELDHSNLTPEDYEEWEPVKREVDRLNNIVNQTIQLSTQLGVWQLVPSKTRKRALRRATVYTVSLDSEGMLELRGDAGEFITTLYLQEREDTDEALREFGMAPVEEYYEHVRYHPSHLRQGYPIWVFRQDQGGVTENPTKSFWTKAVNLADKVNIKAFEGEEHYQNLMSRYGPPRSFPTHALFYKDQKPIAVWVPCR